MSISQSVYTKDELLTFTTEMNVAFDFNNITGIIDKKLKNNKSGGNLKSPGKEVEVVWLCDERRRALLYRKEGDGNGSIW